MSFGWRAALALLIGLAFASVIFMMVVTGPGRGPASTVVPRSTPTPAVAKPLATPAERTTPTPTERATATATGASGVLSIDVTTGQIVTIYQGNARFAIGTLYPELTRGGDAFWLSTVGDTVARRYDLAGNVTASVENAWGVVESANGRTLVYREGTFAGPGQNALTVQATNRAPVSIPGGGFDPAVGATGLVAFAQSAPSGRIAVAVFDPATGATKTWRDDVRLPGKEGEPGWSWSPSGRYFRFYSVEDSSGGASVVMYYIGDATTGEVRAVPASSGGIGDWLPGTPDRYTAVRDGDIVVETADGHELERVQSPIGTFRTVRVAGGLLVGIVGSNGNTTTIAYDADTGTEVKHWNGSAVVADSSAGAVAYMSPTPSSDCVVLDVPRRMDGACFANPRGWSPDGQYFLMTGPAPGRPLEIADVLQGSLRQINLPVPDYRVQWASDSRHVLVTWGGGS